MSIAAVETKKRRQNKRTNRRQLNLFESENPVEQQITHASPKKAKAKRAKKFEDYKLTRPTEIKAFELLSEEEKAYSNSIELYDFIPKHYWGRVERINGQFLCPLEREFECRGVKYKVIIAPARIKDEDGKFRDYYPGRREEIIEAALRKLASRGRGAFLDDSASVVFSLYELQAELKGKGHTYSIAEIKEALFVCVGTRLTISTVEGELVTVSSIFETLGLRTWQEWQKKGQQTQCFVQFNPLVTNSIKNGTFRQLNYDKYMGCKFVIARQLYKRMAHHYIQASLANTYEIMLSTIIRDFGLPIYDRFRDNLREVILALKELVKKDIVLEYKIEKILDAGKYHKLVDAKIIIRPHPQFSGEMIKANERQKKTRALLAT